MLPVHTLIKKKINIKIDYNRVNFSSRAQYKIILIFKTIL